jgi:hypothetical protein
MVSRVRAEPTLVRSCVCGQIRSLRVVLLEGVEERRVVQQLDAFKPREDWRQVRTRILTERQDCAIKQVQVDVRAQHDGPGEVAS